MVGRNISSSCHLLTRKSWLSLRNQNFSSTSWFVTKIGNSWQTIPGSQSADQVLIRCWSGQVSILNSWYDSLGIFDFCDIGSPLHIPVKSCSVLHLWSFLIPLIFLIPITFRLLIPSLIFLSFVPFLFTPDYSSARYCFFYPRPPRLMLGLWPFLNRCVPRLDGA